MKLYYLSVFIVISSCCYCVDVDYYDDENVEENKDRLNINQTVDRRFGDEEVKVDANITNPDNSNVSEKYSAYSTLGIQIQPISNENPIVQYYHSRAKSIKSDSFVQNYSKFVSKLDVFKDYVYLYDDNAESNVLRNDNMSQLYQKQTTINMTEAQKLKEYAIKFYNLEPAAASSVLNDIPRDNNQKVWYVPENYPCWELPLLYGELGQRMNTTEVFLIFGGRLKNVVDPGYNETVYKTPSSSTSYLPNRWCGVLPCYGDHTLCLFPGDNLSKLCEKGYNVQVPSILDQIALVNTINSMRNRVASGESDRYSHLPPAANMKEINYDYDLQKVSEAWLRQCLPGPAPCSALDGETVSHLECTKYADNCCFKSQSAFRCTPKMECFVSPIIGCLHVWYWSAGKNIKQADIKCGRTSVKTYNTVQLLWAKTLKIGCAYGERSNGNIRVVCNFTPGAPFFLKTGLYCGIIDHSNNILSGSFATKKAFLDSLPVFWDSIEPTERDMFETSEHNLPSYINGIDSVNTIWGVQSLKKIYKEGWVRKYLGKPENGTRGMIARLVTKFTFVDESEARCDTNESMYIAGKAGSLCMERGRRYINLCYEFRDPTPGYRSLAVAAPIALFTLILYDLFSGVVRQSN
ncbi:unnamed protein product [Pieris brassicae]|uniref:SCP domain-containing protein n=1 Tax=Pieris brassicae TaxID=7116 RepID=A0A9P0TIG4_PIEBR|nr:unnamed protein product [Pieris brassicae]